MEISGFRDGGTSDYHFVVSLVVVDIEGVNVFIGEINSILVEDTFKRFFFPASL